MAFLEKIVDRLKVSLLRTTHRNILDEYVSSADPTRNAVDIFRGSWCSSFPPEVGVPAGDRPVFDDARIRWALQHFTVEGKRVLELGPLEGGHTYMLHKAGAAEIVAMEANTRSYLKCLVVKELLRLDRARFLCCDFMEYLPLHPEKFDACIACGVLYHMREPVKLLKLISRAADRVFLWTHYYDGGIIEKNVALARHFSAGESHESAGFRHARYRRDYGPGLFAKQSYGGNAPYSRWLPREDILGALRHFGLTRIDVAFEEPNHANGPCFAVVAER